MREFEQTLTKGLQAPGTLSCLGWAFALVSLKEHKDQVDDHLINCRMPVHRGNLVFCSYRDPTLGNLPSGLQGSFEEN